MPSTLAGKLTFAVWQLGSIATAIYLLFFDGPVSHWWGWLIVVPTSLFLAEIWPLYWLILRPLFG